MSTCRRGCLVRVEPEVYVHRVPTGNMFCHELIQFFDGRAPLARGVLKDHFGAISRVGYLYRVCAPVPVLIQWYYFLVHWRLCLSILTVSIVWSISVAEYPLLSIAVRCLSACVRWVSSVVQIRCKRRHWLYAMLIFWWRVWQLSMRTCI